MMTMNKTHNASSLAVLLLIGTLVLPVSSLAANPCTTADGYLDTHIGIMDHTNDSPRRKGIGGTGRSGDEDDKGIGGTGRSGDQDDNGIGGTGVIGHNNGIGGTGQVAENSKLFYVTGTIHAFGSVCVNGVEIEYSADTPVSTDTNNNLKASSLKVGQVVDIIAEKNAGKGMPTARNIAVRFPLQGPVTKVSLDGRLIKVRGKPVHLTDLPAGKSIRLGDNVRVSGLQNTKGQIMATFIERTPNQIPDRTTPSKTKIIPSGISQLSVQGYVQRRTPGGQVIIENQSFDLGVSGKDIKVGTKMIVSGRRQQNGDIKAFSWVRERATLETRLKFGKTRGSGHQNRNRRHGGRKGRSKEDNSGPGRAQRADDNDRIDNSGRGKGRDDRIEKPDNSGRGRKGRPERIDRPDRSGRPERPEHD